MNRILLTAVVLPLLSAPTAAGAASGTRTFDEQGATGSVTCTRSLSKVIVNGADSTIRVRGRCRSIAVTGSGVRVTADVVDVIRVDGSNSRVSYKKSRSGGRASVSATAQGAKVTRRR